MWDPGSGHPPLPTTCNRQPAFPVLCPSLQDANYELKAATDSSLAAVSGAYFVGGRESRAPAAAYDAAAQRRLWALLEEQTGAAWSV